MLSLHIGTMLAYLVGATIIVCVVMALYWSKQRVPPGFGLWTASCALICVACVALADRSHLPKMVTTMIVPSLVVVAAVFRLEGLKRLLGRERVDRRSLSLPIVVAALLTVLTYFWNSPSARSTVTTVAITLVFWVMAVVLFQGARPSLRVFFRSLTVLFVVYGALWLGSGIHWLVKATGFPLTDIDVQGVIFFAAITAFEFFWLIGCLVISSRWDADELEDARGLAERERRQLADILACLPDAAFALDMEQKVIAWNRAAEAKTGVATAEVVGSSLGEGGARTFLGDEVTLSEALLDPTKSIPDRFREVKREPDSLSAVEEWGHPEMPGWSGHFWHMARLLKDPQGQVTGTIESMRDITWRIEVESAMRESEERYRSLFEHSLDGLLVLAPGGAVVDANPAASQMLAMTKEELCAATPGSLIKRSSDEDSPFAEHLVPGGTVRELEFVRGDGSVFPAECMSVVWNDSTGHIRAFVQFRDIGERAAAQRILRESQARLLEAQATPIIGNWEIDMVGQSIWLSPEALSVFGLEKRAPYIPLDITVFTGMAEEPQVIEAAIGKVMGEGGSYDLEYSIRRADDGALRKVHSIGAAVCDAGGVPVKVVGATRDITETIATLLPDHILRSARHPDDQVFWVEPDGRITNVSESACVQLGYAREELLAMSIYDLNPSISPGSTEAIERLKALGSRSYETIHMTKDGRAMPVEVVINYATHGGKEYKFVVAHDISERKHLEETLQRTQLSLDQRGDVVMWSDAEGQIAFVTEAACSHLGYSREELLSMKVFEIDRAASKDWGSVWAELMASGTLSREALYRASDGREDLMEVVLSRVEHGGREYALCAAHEVGPEGSASRESSVGEMEKLQHERLEAVGQLAGGIAHDFNSLLTAIIGYGNLILADEDTGNLHSLRRDAEEIRSAAQRAADLTSQILAFARRQPLRPKKVALGDFVAGIEEDVRALLTDDIEMVIVSPSETGTVEVDMEQFGQVVTNLAKNACDAMPAGGRLVIETKNVELSDEHCRSYPELRPGSYVLFSVSDSGVGMDADTRLRIFEPFFTTKPPGGGVGLGLSMVYGFVRQSGGHVLAYSEIDKGTTIKVYLPRLAGPADPAACESLPAGIPGKGGETVLVVEDEPSLRRLVARVLGEQGYRVYVAGNGPEALELLEDLGTAPELLITDVVLPGGLQGNELASRFVSAIPHLPVLYMSGHPRDAIVHAGRLDAGVNFLGKPFTPERLAAKVREVLDSH